MFVGPKLNLLLLLMLLVVSSGCSLMLPEVTHQPIVRNPFPQFSKVAVLPFFNQSDEATVDGAQFAQAYFDELQSVQGFEVVPIGVAQRVAKELGVDLSTADGRRLLADQLGADALVIGTVTSFTPYYPPRCGMRVDWYAANAGFHEIPVGYGLPWGTPDEEYIPGSLVFEAELALARKQMETQTPSYTPPQLMPPTDEQMAKEQAAGIQGQEPLPYPMRVDKKQEATDETMPPAANEPEELPMPPHDESAIAEAFETPTNAMSAISSSGPTAGIIGNDEKNSEIDSLPMNWPDARGFTPPGPMATRPKAKPHNGPVMTHTRIFRGNDTEFTAALASYVSFKDDARFGGWESYLDRSDDFIHFCCHLHITEMLSARGGSSQSRVVRQWSPSR